MNYHQDDGSTFGGVITVALCLLCLYAGYTVRDRGITFRVQIPTIQRGVR